MAKERILITVKTYPTLSSKYGELVCTAGLKEDGSWIRIYPIPFRQLDDYRKFEKYRIIEADVVRNTSDPRPESHKIDSGSIVLTDEPIGTEGEWRERKEWIKKGGIVYDNLSSLIEKANRNELSLATFKPTKLIDLKAEAVSAEWKSSKLEAIETKSVERDLFEEWDPIEVGDLVRKVPWKFSYMFEDVAGKRSTMMIEDWEIGALYWNCVRAKGHEGAVNAVRQKYWDEFKEKDLHFFLGTTRRWHGVAPNPFVIIGVFYPPIQYQQELF